MARDVPKAAVVGIAALAAAFLAGRASVPEAQHPLHAEEAVQREIHALPHPTELTVRPRLDPARPLPSKPARTEPPSPPSGPETTEVRSGVFVPRLDLDLDLTLTFEPDPPVLLRGDGSFRVTFPDGRPMIEGEFREGVLHGPWRAWHKSGALESEGTYEKGKKEGDWRTYYENGAPTSRAEYVAGAIEGSLRRWHPDGTLAEETVYEGGRPNGGATTWHPGGAVRERGRWVGGQKDGTWTTWDPQGRQVREEDWIAGVLGGPIRLFDPAGTFLHEPEALEKASVGGKYSRLLRRVAAPDDRDRYPDFHDYGFYAATDYLGEAGVPAGFWVYVFPYWYVWGDAESGGR